MNTLLKRCGLLCLSGLIVFAVTASADVIVQISSPADGDYFSPCNDITVTADVQATAGETIERVRFYYNGLTLGSVRRAPYERDMRDAQSGTYNVYAVAVDGESNEYTSETVQFKVGPVSSGERLRNSAFTCGKLAPWTLNNYEGASSTAYLLDDDYFGDGNYVMIDIVDGSSADWHIQFSQPMPTDSGHTYEITFMADAWEQKPVTVGMQESNDPYETQMWQTIEIDGFNEYGPLTFEAFKTDPTNLFKICPGGNTTALYLDQIHVVDRSATSVKSKELSFDGSVVSEFELLQAYPNPFNMNTTIQYRLGQTADITLDIYNLEGQKIRTLVNGSQSDGTHSAHWNGATDAGQIVPSGVYFYRLQVAGERVDLSRKILLVK